MKSTIKALLAKVKSLVPARFRRSARIVPIAVLAVAILVITGVIMSRPAAVPTLTTEEYQDTLRSEVDDVNGEPRDGRNPANQQQNSLASAASKSTGRGQGSDGSPTPDDHSHEDHSEHSDPDQAAIGTNGCFVDYGIPGEQCLPAHAATNGTLTCDGVHMHFANGIVVSGMDRYHLDTNHDDIACGTGD